MRLGQVADERGVGPELLDRRARGGQSQQRLGEAELRRSARARRGFDGRSAVFGLRDQRGPQTRARTVTVDLATQGVEDAGGRRGNNDLHVAVLVLTRELVLRRVDVGVVVAPAASARPRVANAQLQEALDAGRRVLRPLAVVAVRQGHDEAGALQPLALARGDELVDDDLRAVGKVADCRVSCASAHRDAHCASQMVSRCGSTSE